MTVRHHVSSTDPVRIRGNFLTDHGFASGLMTVSGSEIQRFDLDHGRPDPSLPLYIPGFCDLHASGFDYLGGERRGAKPAPARSLLRHDATMAVTGVTRALTTLSLDNPDGTGTALAGADQALVLLAEAQDAGALRVAHRVHLRCELVDDGVAEAAGEILERHGDRIGLISLMDHSPGQGQFRSYDAWRPTVAARLGQDEARISRLAAGRREASAGAFRDRARSLAEAARPRGIVVASHDSETEDQIDFAREIGTTVCEFPTTLAAARAAGAAGMLVVAGAPNFVNGGSHVGNVSARELMDHVSEVALSYDYSPTVLHQAWNLSRASRGPVVASARTSSRAHSILHPAEAGGPALRAGGAADFLEIAGEGRFFRVVATWSAGRRVA